MSNKHVYKDNVITIIKKNDREKTVLFDQSRGESTYYVWREYSLKAL